MTETPVVRVAEVMKSAIDIFDGKLTVKEALLAMKHPETRALIVDKRGPDDEYGLVLLSDIAKKVLAADRSPERVNLYEIMAKPILTVHASMDIRFCAKLLESFSLTRVPVTAEAKIVGIVSYDDLVLRGLMQSIQ